MNGLRHERALDRMPSLWVVAQVLWRVRAPTLWLPLRRRHPPWRSSGRSCRGERKCETLLSN